MPGGGPSRLGSLSAGLLARKGQARPAMRPQTVALNTPIAGEDDLGWNDMGGDAPAPAPAPELPPVLVQRQTLSEELAAPIAQEPAPVVVQPAPVIVTLAPAKAAKTRAAFTLRLDPERHLRLRLAATLHGASAQVLVTRALDSLLQSMPEIEALASQLPARAHRTSVGDVR